MHHPLMRAFVATCCMLSANSFVGANDQSFFAEHVAPILERRCLSCHNDEQRRGDFSLQTAKGTFENGYVLAGDTEGSYLLDVVTSEDAKIRMPKDADPLSATEIALIRKWIATGAEWPAELVLKEAQVTDFDWWSYQPLTKPRVPLVDSTWIRSPIDAFILQQHQRNGLQHAREADRRTLIRRVTYDLIGLPPSPEATEKFVNDPDPYAYERLVERLLASKQYGERWARHWLDIVKYADTCGYDKDKLRPNAWPYRDYVVRSFNEDKPYSRFVREQIAGDVLFPGEPDGILGLGFIAAGPWDFIGHVEVAESKIDGKIARNLDRDEMVTNTLNTFCSVTIQCARCHNHKFDPFTQQHYYSLQAVFAAVDRADRPYDLDPHVENQRRLLAARLTELEAERGGVQRQIDAAGGESLAESRSRIAALQAALEVRKDPEYGYHSAIADKQETSKWVQINLKQPTEISRIVLHPCHDEFAGIGPGFGFPIRFKVEVSQDGPESNESDWIIIADHTSEDFSNPGLAPVKFACEAPGIRQIRITATKLAERKQDYIFALAEVEVIGKGGEPLPVSPRASVTARDSIEAPVRWSRDNLVDGKWARVSDPDKADELFELTRRRDQILKTINTPERLGRLGALDQRIVETKAELNALPEGAMVYAAATRFTPQGNFKPTEGKPRPIHVLHRGDMRTPTEKVGPGLLPFAADVAWELDDSLTEGERRAELARWLTRTDHPLVWRSIVNRIWQYHFGTGIVATPNDFGHMGAQPTHPDLLDWLACEFRDRGQSFKTLHRLIVTSSVYRQSSEFHPENREIDAGNRFLWRMNRRRLEAEEIRDSILAISGTLDPTMGGPGFYLFELEKPQHSPHFQYHKFDPSDPASHRRSIYRFIARSQPNPWMTTLDCADSSQSTPTRNETLTSLQALSLLNSRFNLFMARRFAARLEQHSNSLEEQVGYALLLTTQRPPTSAERQDCLVYAERHGLDNLCRLLFNLSELIYVD